MSWYKKADNPSFDPVYHGTPNTESIMSRGFVYDFLGEREDQYGPGFYFATHYEYAKTFTEPKDRNKAPSFGLGKPGVIQAQIFLKKPIVLEASMNARSQFPVANKAIIAKLIQKAEEEFGDKIYQDWGDIRYYGKQKIRKEMIEGMDGSNSLTILYDLFGDDISKGLRAYSKITGYDGVIVNLDKGDRLVGGTVVNLQMGGQIVVAWFPEQIKIIQGNTK
jgi:hypothetical protein